MARKLSTHLIAVRPELRYQSTLKRVRARLGDQTIVDTRSAMLVWEPRRVVPTYAVPQGDVTAVVTGSPDRNGPEQAGFPLDEGPPVLDPRIPFAVHTAPGTPLDVTTPTARAPGAAFRPDDPDLDGYVVLDFAAFDWLEEDEPVIGHARDPFHRIDVRRSSDHVQLEHEGLELADSQRPQALFEGTFPLVRYYLPREDVRVELRPGTIRTVCAYKGVASHYSAVADGVELANIAWSYEDPLSDAIAVKGLISFYQERLDLRVNGQLQQRQRTPWS